MALMSMTTLRQRMAADHDLVVCDVRYSLTDASAGRSAFDQGHLPGAVFVDLHDDLSDIARGGGRHPLPSTAGFGATLGRLGIGPRTTVVGYDAAGGAFAARLWWMLRAVGHHNVSVLDGGLNAWLETAGPLTTVVPVRPVRTYPVPDEWSGVTDADGVAAALADGRTVVDCRAPERFRGEVEPLDSRAGHIPGAVNLFHGANLGSDGFHRPLAELRQRFAAVAATDRPVFYCGSGVSACHQLLVMSAAGVPHADDAVLYPGSWSDWSSQPGRPIATGDA